MSGKTECQTVNDGVLPELIDGVVDGRQLLHERVRVVAVLRRVCGDVADDVAQDDELLTHDARRSPAAEHHTHNKSKVIREQQERGPTTMNNMNKSMSSSTLLLSVSNVCPPKYKIPPGGANWHSFSLILQT